MLIQIPTQTHIPKLTQTLTLIKTLTTNLNPYPNQNPNTNPTPNPNPNTNTNPTPTLTITVTLTPTLTVSLTLTLKCPLGHGHCPRRTSSAADFCPPRIFVRRGHRRTPNKNNPTLSAADSGGSLRQKSAADRPPAGGGPA